MLAVSAVAELNPSSKFEFLATNESDISVSVIVLLSISFVPTAPSMILAAATELFASSLAHTLSAARSDAVSVLFCISLLSMVPSVILSPLMAVIEAPLPLRVVKLPVPAYILDQRAAVDHKVIVLVVYG